MGARGQAEEDEVEGGLGAGAPIGRVEILPCDDRTGLANRASSSIVGSILRAMVGGRGAKAGWVGVDVISEGGGADAG